MPPKPDFKIIHIGREILLYREGDQYVPVYAEYFKKDERCWLEVEAGGIKLWHPSAQLISEPQLQTIIARITSHAEADGSGCEIKYRDTPQVRWQQRWDKNLKMIATVEALPFQVKFKGWAWHYTKGDLQVTIPILKPFYREDYKVIRLQPPHDWAATENARPVLVDEIKRDVSEWARISEFAFEFLEETPPSSSP